MLAVAGYQSHGNMHSSAHSATFLLIVFVKFSVRLVVV